MRVLITAGPTREYIDAVRFISNASSGRMGCVLAEAALAAGHEVTLLLGAGASADVSALADRAEVVHFTSVEELQAALTKRFANCDVLLMAAAVGDFRAEKVLSGKLPRAGGPVKIRLVPTPDVLASVTVGKRADQCVIAFAVEQGSRDEIEAKARTEMRGKGADMVVLNTPAAMAAEDSDACVLTGEGVALPWARRNKQALAEEIIKLLN